MKKNLSFLLFNLLFIGGILAQPPCTYDPAAPIDGTVSIPPGTNPGTDGGLLPGEILQLTGLIQGQMYLLTFCAESITGANASNFDTEITVFEGNGIGGTAIASNEDGGCANPTAAEVSFIYMGASGAIDVYITNNYTEPIIGDGPCSAGCSACAAATIGFQCLDCPAAPTGPPCPYDNVPEGAPDLSAPQDNVANTQCCVSPGEFLTMCNLVDGEEYTITTCSVVIPGATGGSFDPEITIFTQGGGTVVTFDEGDGSCGLNATVTFIWDAALYGGNCIDILIDNADIAAGGPCSNSFPITGTRAEIGYQCNTCPPPPVDPPCPYDNSAPEVTLDIAPFNVSNRYSFLAPGESAMFCNLQIGQDYTFTFCSEEVASADPGTFDTEISVYLPGGGAITDAIIGNEDGGCTVPTAASVTFTWNGPGDCVEVLVDNNATSEGGSPCSNSCLACLSGTLGYVCETCPPPPVDETQNNDCVRSQTICINDVIDWNSVGPGADDFANPLNQSGCLIDQETQSAWYYFEFDDQTPPGTLVEFTLDPVGGDGEDYDFAVWGPNVNCDNLGAPIRCSAASPDCGLCPATGVGMGAADPIEDPGCTDLQPTCDGFVSSFAVNPGEGYYLMIDNWLGSTMGFTLTFILRDPNTNQEITNTIDCDAQAPCGVETDAGADFTSCGGDMPMLSGSATFSNGSGAGATYSWQGNVAGSTDFLSNPNSPTPTVNIPQDFSGMITYVLTVVDGECSNSDQMVLTVEAAGNPGQDGMASACTGGASINLFDFLGGNPETGGTWSPALGGGDQGVFDPSSDAPGVYTYTVSPGGACPDATATVNVTVGGPTAAIAGNTAICTGQSTDLTASGGVSYQWDDAGNSTTAMITVSMPGTYNVTVTDANMCTDTESIVVTQAMSPVPAITGNLDICPGDNTTLDAGSFANYNWSPNGETSQTITAAAAGQYCVTVTDASGCTGETCVTVNEFTAPAPSIAGDLEICAGGSTTLDAGNFASYTWTPNGETTQTITAMAAGQYCVTVTDANGCTGLACVTVTETPGLTPAIAGNLSICAGQSTALDAGVYASYLWSPNNETTQTIMPTAGGQYCVTVTDADGCTGSTCATVMANPNPIATIAGSTTFCTGQSTTLDAGAGFTYQWSPGLESSQTITVSNPGQYCVTITDANGCTDDACVDITESSSLMPNISGNTSFCEGGSAMLNAGAGFATYSWSPNNETTQNIVAATPGQYCVTVSDASGCTGSACVDIMQNANPTAMISGATSICAGGSTTLDATGAGLTYLWSPDGQTSATINATSAGQYCVTVTNAEGCTNATCVDVMETTALMPAISGDLNYCDGGSTVLTADAGFDTYMWTPGGATTPNISVNNPGQYCVIVSDAAGCTGQTCVTVTESAALNPNIMGDASICAGSSTLLDGGVFAGYNWMPGNQNTQTITVTMSGTYTLVVTDANGCTGTDDFTVTVNPNPTVTIAGSTAFCTGGITTLDAGPGYASYTWSPNNQTSQSIIVGTAGQYCVTVTDANNCTAQACVMVNESSSLEPNIGGPTSFCPGETITLDGGSGFSSYMWSPGNQTTQTIAVSAAGNYTLVVADGSGCTGEATIAISEDTEPMPMISGDLQICPGETTSLDAGAGFASYSWDFNGNINQNINNVPAGTYCVTVTNAAGCEGTNCVTVTETAAPVANITGASVIPPGGSTMLSANTGFVSYLWSPNGETTETITANAPGDYCVTVTNANGCTGSSCITVTESTGVIVNISGDNNFCEGESVTLDAGAGFTNYQWGAPGNETTQTITVSSPGTYSVTVTNADGNTGEDAIVITQNPTPMVSITGDADFCAGQSATLTAGGGFANYLWDDPTGSTTPSITVNQTGTYSVTVTSAEGCTNTASFTTTQNPNPMVQISGSSTFCAGSSTMLDAGQFAAYNWSTNEMTQTITVNTAGNYTVTVTDNNGCTGLASLTVTEDSELAVNITGNDSFCEGGNTVLNAGGGAGFTYLWNTTPPQVTQTITVNTAGDYAVTVTDPMGGCTGTDMISIAVNPNPTPTISGNTSFCIGNSTVLDAGAGFSNYNWSNGSVNQTITANASGTFSVTVTDGNGCTGMASIMVEQTDGLSITITGDTDFCAGETATIDAGAGTGWTYIWSNMATTQTIDVNMAGTYSVTVTDASGCSGEDEITINQNPDALASITGALSFCEGTSTVLSVDDLPGYSYSWMPNGETTASITVAEPGLVSVTTTNADGCTATDMVMVEETDGLTITVDGANNFCNGGSTLLDAGTGNGWTYLWNTTPTQTTQTITVDATNNYSVTVTDASGCTGVGTLSVTESPVLTVNIAGSTTYCVGSFTTLDAGTGNGWSYLWSPNNETTQSITVMAPGDYTVMVTDANGCTAMDLVTVTEDTQLNPNISGNPEYCENGSTTLDAGAGFANYNWEDPNGNMTTSQMITANTPGTYILMVDDGNGCTGTQSITVVENANPTIEITGDDAICEGDISTLTVAAGFESYVWTGPVASVTNTVAADENGNYAVIVTDDNGCSATDNFDLQVATIPTASAGADNTIDCINTTAILDGSAATTGAGISYLWTGPGIDASNETEQNPNVAVAGTYLLTVTEPIAGCSDTDMVVIDQDGDLPIAEAGTDMEINCIEFAPTLDGSGSSTGNMTYTWTGPGITGTNMNQLSPQINAAGTYTLTVLNNDNGCSATDMVTVTENTIAPDAIIGLVIPLDCQNTSITIDGTQSSAGANIAYQWFDSNGPIAGANSPTYETSVTDNFTLVVTNNDNGCIASDEVLVDDITAFPVVEVAALGTLDCMTDEVTLTSAGSQTGATIVYEWFEGAGLIGTGATIVVQGVGPYTLSVRDTDNGCQNEEAITVESNMEAPVASAGAAQQLDCFDNTLSLDGSASSQGTVFVYTWSSLDGNPIDGTTTISPNVSEPGIYELLVTNTENGCTASDQVLVAANQEIPTAVTVEMKRPTCANENDGIIQITDVIGGVGPFLYTIGTTSFQENPTFTNLSAGDFTLTVQSPNGCIYEEELTLMDGNNLDLDLGEDQRINLGESADIIAAINIDPMNLSNISWTASDSMICDGCLQTTVTPDFTTSYTLTIEDENGCRVKDDIIIFVNANQDIFAPNVFSPNGDGENDRFTLFAGDNVETVNYLNIFTRWGTQVYSNTDFLPNDTNGGFDGVFKGKVLNPQVLIWKAEVTFINGETKVFMGDVILVK